MRTFRSLRHRNYRLYFFGQLASLVGSWTQSTAVMWLAHQQTGMSTWPAILISAQIGPTLLLGPIGGRWADSMPKRPLIVRSQLGFLCCSLALLGLHMTDVLNQWGMLAIMLAHGFFQAVDLPARLAFLPSLIDRDDLGNAVALNSLLFNLARAIGPAIAAQLLVSHGAGACFFLNALSYGGIFYALCAIRIPPEVVAPKEYQSGNGFAALAKHPPLFLLIILVGMTAVSGWPLLALLPAYADRVLAGGEGTYSTLLSGLGVGALCAALTAATLGSAHHRRAILQSGLAAVLVGLVGMSSARSLPFAVASAVIFGYGMILFFATAQTAVQVGIPDADRGKIMGVWAMMLSAGVPFGNLILGPLADVVGIIPVLITQAVMVVVVFSIVLGIRRIGSA